MDHYETLGVARTATSAEIKRAYRRLAVLYHPDKNPDPAAESFFKEVNVAYDILSDPVKKRAYDLRGQTIFEPYHYQQQRQQQPKHRDPAYRNPNRPKPKYKGERQRLLELMAEYLPQMQKFTIGCLILSTIVIVDFILPHRVSQETIDDARRVVTSSGGRHRNSTAWWVITTSKGKEVDVENHYSEELPIGKSVAIESSRLFNVPRYIATNTTHIRIAKSLYGNFFFGPIGLFIFSLLGYLFRNKIETSFNIGVTCGLVLILNAVFVILL